MTLSLIAVLVIRANTVFPDRQLEPLKLHTAIALDEEAAIRRFSQAITIPTVSHDDRNNFDEAAFLHFHRFLENAYPLVHQQTVRTVINDYSVVFHLEGSDHSLKPVLFMSHMDVVPIDSTTRGLWTHEPFGGAVDDDKIWGRGALDDKMGVIGLMEAMELLLLESRKAERSVYLAFGHDEEVGGVDGAGEVARYFADQGIEFDFVLDEGGAITEGLVAGFKQPVAVIGVAEKGHVNLNLVVNAPGGHSSQPPEHTAVGILSQAIVKIENNPFPADVRLVRDTFEHIGNFAPFSLRFVLGNAWLFNRMIEQDMLRKPGEAAGIRTTTAATMVSGSPKSNILPTRATGVVNFRILPGETVETVKQRITEIVDDDRVEITAEYGQNPSKVSPTDSTGYALIARTIRAFDNEILVAPYMVRGGTDAKYFYALSPNVYRFVMVRANAKTIKLAHGIDEHVPVSDYLNAIRFYYHMISQSIR